MKVIDLLNKIANGEEVPKKIKFNGKIYEYRGYMYCTEKANYQDLDDYLFGHWNFLILNDEVEIIEEKKIPEKISVWYEFDGTNDKVLIKIMLNELKDKYNEIIDFLKSKGE